MSGILPLRLADVVFTAGGRTIIDGVNLTLGAGPSTIILGANGAGKSVLMRLMHGLLAPSSGHVLWSGEGARRSIHLDALKDEVSTRGEDPVVRADEAAPHSVDTGPEGEASR